MGNQMWVIQIQVKAAGYCRRGWVKILGSLAVKLDETQGWEQSLNLSVTPGL